MLFVVTFWIGISAVAVASADAGVDDHDQDENEFLEVSEGGNLSISIHIKKSDEDPQVLVSRLKGFSHEAIAQITCHNRVCGSEYWISGVSLMFDGENVTLVLMNFSYNQTGRYMVQKLSESPLENKIYNVTLCQHRPGTISPEPLPSVPNIKSFTAGVISALVCVPLLFITAAVIAGVLYWKKRKTTFYYGHKTDLRISECFIYE